MYTCKQCHTKFSELTGKYSSGDFCSKRCAKAYAQSFVHGTKKILCCWCGKEFDGNVRRILVNSYCSDECYKEKRKHIRNCSVCGSKYGECPRPDICKKQFNQLKKNLTKYFGFDQSTICSLKVIDEFDRIKKMLDDDYNVAKMSIPQMAEKYGHDNVGNFGKLLYSIGVETRNLSESQKTAIMKGRRVDLPLSTKYRHGYHTTWNGKQIYYRSSYELDFACELDKKKINYDVENLRIEYFDSQKEKNRVAIPDFYLPDTNEIVEIKSNYTYDEQNMLDRSRRYKELGYGFRLILEHEEVFI